MAMGPQAFTLTGLERVNGAEYAQSWLYRRKSNLLAEVRSSSRPSQDTGSISLRRQLLSNHGSSGL